MTRDDEFFERIDSGRGPLTVASQQMGINNEEMWYVGRMNWALNVLPIVGKYYKTKEEALAALAELRVELGESDE